MCNLRRETKKKKKLAQAFGEISKSVQYSFIYMYRYTYTKTLCFNDGASALSNDELTIKRKKIKEREHNSWKKRKGKRGKTTKL